MSERRLAAPKGVASVLKAPRRPIQRANAILREETVARCGPFITSPSGKNPCLWAGDLPRPRGWGVHRGDVRVHVRASAWRASRDLREARKVARAPFAR